MANYYRDPKEDRKTGPYVEAAFATYVPSADKPEKK
jgi:hypothetical protein